MTKVAVYFNKLEAENRRLTNRNKALLKENELLKADVQEIKLLYDSLQEESKITSKQNNDKTDLGIKDSLMADLELSSDDDENSIMGKEIVIDKKKERKVCEKCQILQSELTFEKALNFTRQYQMLSPIPEEKYFRTVSVQTDHHKSNLLPTQDNIISMKGDHRLDVHFWNTYDVFKTVRKNRDKLIIAVNDCGYKYTNSFNRLDLESVNALPEIMKIIYSFLSEVVDCIQESFEVLTKHFNKVKDSASNAGHYVSKSINNEDLQMCDDYGELTNNRKRHRPLVDEIGEKRKCLSDTEELDYNLIYDYNKCNNLISPIKSIRGSPKVIRKAKKISKICPNAVDKKLMFLKKMSVLSDSERLKKNVEIFTVGKKIKKTNTTFIQNNSSLEVLKLLDQTDEQSTQNSTNDVVKKTRKRKRIPRSKAQDVNTENTEVSSDLEGNKNELSSPIIPNMLTDNNILTTNENIEKSTNTNGQNLGTENNETESNEDHNTELNISQSEYAKNQSITTVNNLLITNQKEFDQDKLIVDSTSTSVNNVEEDMSCDSNFDTEGLNLLQITNESNEINVIENNPNRTICNESNLLSNIEQSNSNVYTDSSQIQQSTPNGDQISSSLNNQEGLNSEQSCNLKDMQEINSLVIPENTEMNSLNLSPTKSCDDNQHKILDTAAPKIHTQANDVIETHSCPATEDMQLSPEVEPSTETSSIKLNFYADRSLDPDDEPVNKNKQAQEVKIVLSKLNENEINNFTKSHSNAVNNNINNLQNNDPPVNNIHNAAFKGCQNQFFNPGSSSFETEVSEFISIHNSTQHSYEYFESNVNVLCELIKKHTCTVDNFNALTRQFPKTTKSTSKKICQMKLILMEFLENQNLYIALPQAIKEIQNNNFKLSIVFSQCFLYAMTEEWSKIFQKNPNCIRNLIALIRHMGQMYDGFINYLLKAISYKTFRLKRDDDADKYTLLYTQVYIALCVQNADASSLLMFLVDSLYGLHIKCLLVFEQLIIAWPGILEIYDPSQTDNILHTTIKILLLNFKNLHHEPYNKIQRKIQQSIVCGYKIPEEGKDVDSLLSRILLHAKNDPNLEVFLSVILLARRENPAWVMNKLINQGFLALLQDTWNNYQISTDKTAKSALLKTIKLCINVLSATSRTIDELNKDKVTMIIHVLKKILSNSESGPDLQETIISALIQLSRQQFDIVADVVMSWSPNFLPSELLINRLKRLITRNTKLFWNCKLKYDFEQGSVNKDNIEL